MKKLKENNQKLMIGNNNSLLILFFLIGIGLLIRLYHIPFQVPISVDGIDYFTYAIAINKEGYFPEGYISLNFGWSTFLSFIFSLSGSNEMMELMNIQRIFSSLISVFTAIPIYFICKTFFKNNIAILGAALFLFTHHVIENSILGITDPLFVFLVTVAIMFVFVKETKLFYLSFVFAALAGFTRYEGFLLIFPLLITFFIRKDFQKKSILRTSLGVILFISIMILINMTAYEQSNVEMLSPIFGGAGYVSNVVISNNTDPNNPFFTVNTENQFQEFAYNSIITYTKYLGWIMIPVLGFFIIPGLFLTRKKLTKNKMIFLSFIVFLSISSLYAYGRGIQETRYLYPLIPILILFSCQFFDFLDRKSNIKKIMIVTVFTIIILSILFLEYEKPDYEYEEEISDATVYAVNVAKGINTYDGSKFVRPAAVENSWPELPQKDERGKITANIKKISSKNFENIEQFIEENKSELSHLVIVKEEKQLMLKDVFDNEKKYDYLEKIYDSQELGFQNQIKIFKINFDIFNSKSEK